MEILIYNITLALYNVILAFMDYQKWKKKITIDHKDNLIIYTMLMFPFLIRMFFPHLNWSAFVTLLLQMFLLRQLFFDCTFNFLAYRMIFYTPQIWADIAWWDRIEIKLFGEKAGKPTTIIYTCIYLLTLIFQFYANGFK